MGNKKYYQKYLTEEDEEDENCSGVKSIGMKDSLTIVENTLLLLELLLLLLLVLLTDYKGYGIRRYNVTFTKALQ